ncbi:MAG: sorbosone dehydrogenase family protein [Flavobacteriales bacterium]|nr:sorbosone dehydrogenase family protein [Flavobacteriales bacterium]MCC6938673.1 sorbosone dehydrogenase family protein [Flavobacteriales bacterium]
MSILARLTCYCGLGLLLNGSVCVPGIRGGAPSVEGIAVPPGFRITLFAEDVPSARAMCWGDKGTLFVGSRSDGDVYALRDTNNDGRADEKHVIASHLNMPVGVAFRNGSLYVSAVDRILRLDAIEDHLTDPPAPVVVTSSYPTEEHHGWKFIAFGPDGKLYVPVGAPCNNCVSEDSIYASITRINPDGTGREIIARGVRNTVGFDWHPGTGELWFTDNGRDWLGDDSPDCELNVLRRIGDHFGYPYCHAGAVSDPEYGKLRPCSEFVPPAAKLGPHVAPLGMRFYTGTSFPEKYHHAIFIAEHGSWNRSTPIGYRVVVAYPQPDGSARTEVFAEGWLKGNRASGRPVDVLVAPDGALLVSDDGAGAIYRISYDSK